MMFRMLLIFMKKKELTKNISLNVMLKSKNQLVELIEFNIIINALWRKLE
jgi:hypothetical protein